MEDFSEKMAIKYPYFFKNFPAGSIPGGWHVIFANMIEDIDVYIDKTYYPNMSWEKPNFEHPLGIPNRTSESIREIIENYEKIAKVSCSVCGSRNDIVPTGWVDTRCRSHADV